MLAAGSLEPRSRARTLGQTLIRSYLVIVLLGAVLAGPAPQAWIALGLLVPQALILYRAPPARWDLPLILITVAVTPWSFAALLGPVAAVAIILPGLPLIEMRLRDLAGAVPVPSFRAGRRPTPALSSLALVVLFVGLLGFAAGSVTTILVAAILLLGVLVLMGLILVATRDIPVSVEAVTLSVLVGNQGQARFRLRNESVIPLRVVLSSSDTGVTLSPIELAIGARSEQEIGITATPSLSGPAEPEILVMLLDPWGFLWRGTVIQPLRLQVIPRARYAAWLARRYLDQSGGRQLSPASGHMQQSRGVEFTRLREYQPGDRLRDVDWRRSGRLRELVTREYRDPQRGGTTILVNLMAKDPEEADWVGYHLISSALTAAQEGIPAGLAAYNEHEPVLVTGLSHPRETLKNALRVSKEISLTSGQTRLLAPPDMLHLRRTAQNLGGIGTDGPQAALGQLLVQEIESLEDLAQGHPLSLALPGGLRGNPPPATLILVSRWNHDAEALAVVLPRLKQQGYRVLDLCTMHSSHGMTNTT